MKGGWLGILLAALFGAPLMGVAAQSHYVVGVESIDYRPFQSGHRGVFEGFGRDLLDAFAAAEGLELHYLPLPPPRLLVSLLRGRVDFKYPDDPSWQPQSRQGKAIHYSRPIVGYLDGTLVLPAHLGRPVTRIRTLGTVVGFTPLAWLDRLGNGQVMLKENADFAALFRQVLDRRLDAAYANVLVARDQSWRLLKRSNVLVFDPALPHARGDYRLSSLRHPGVLARFDRWLLDHPGQLRALEERYGLVWDPAE